MSDAAAEVEVRPARPEELAAVGDLTVRAYLVGTGMAADSPYVTELRRAEERAAASSLLVALRAGELVGAVSLCPYGSGWTEIAHPGELELRMLVVEPAAFGTGVGDALVEAGVEHATANGFDRVVLSVVADNTPAHRLYLRHGFTREPARDWSPVPDVDLLGYVLSRTGTRPAVWG